MQPWLNSYPLDNDAQFLIDGFSQGFRIPYEKEFKPRISNNHKSAINNSEIIWEKLEKEIALGRVAGPFKHIPLNGNIMVSPIGLVEKKSSNDFRLIFDLSYPKSFSVNDGISSELSKVQYTSFDKAISMTQKMGRHSLLAKLDIQSAFRLLPICPDDFKFLGMQHEGFYFVDKTLPFGCSISCAHFEKFSTFLEHCIKEHTNTNNWMHYLDDFLVGDKKRESANVILSKALSLLNSFGVPIAKEKIFGPATIITFLGIEIDTEKMQVRIPQEKIVDILDQIDMFIEKHANKSKFTLRQLQSIIGKLNFACKAIQPGRAFSRRLIDATIGLSKPFHHKRVSDEMVQDLIMWKQFLVSHNGITMMLPNEWLDNESLNFFTDSSGSIGFGIIFENAWIAAAWPDNLIIPRTNIAFLELFPIVMAILIWGPSLQNKRIVFNCDNLSVVNMISKQSSKDRHCMAILRQLVLTCLQLNIVIKASHVLGNKNCLADALSRFQFQKFFGLNPTADKNMTPIPPSVCQKLLPK